MTKPYQTDLGMYTEQGNTIVEGVLMVAVKNDHPWNWIEEQLNSLSDCEQFAEASDTAVREECWAYLEDVEAAKAVRNS